MLARTLTERVQNPDPHPPRGCPSNSLGPVWANMYSDPFSATTPAVVGIQTPVRVKWRETIPLQEEFAGRDIPFIGDNLLRRYLWHESRLCNPASFGLATIAPSQGVESPVPTDVHTLAWTAADECCENPPKKIFFGRVWCGRTQFQ